MACKQYRSWLWLLPVVLTISSVPRSLPAQTPPLQIPSLPDVQPFPAPIPSFELLQPLPPPEELLQPSLPTPTPLENAPGGLQTINIERFEVVGSTVFSSEQLAKVLAPFTNKPISFAELFQARSAITQLYFDNGYITSGAYIPPQTLQGKVVTITVLEGGLESLQVTGTKYLNSNYIRRRLAIATNTPINRDRLLQALQLLQLNPLISNISAELSAGTRPSQSILAVQVTEAQSTTVQATIDNGRSPAAGSFRRNLQLNEGNLLGIGDRVIFAYANTDGSNAIDASYALPLNPRNGTLSLGYSTNSSSVIEPPFDLLDISSESRYYDVTLRQPIIQTPSQELAVGISASRLESETSLLDIPFALSIGADEQGRTRISALRFFQEWTGRNTRQVIAARSQFNLGVGAFDATVNAEKPDSRFLSWQGQTQWVRRLAPETLLLVRGNVQLSANSLLPLEQFSLGGLQNVRGYRQDLLLTDNGAFASAEVRLPVLRVSGWNAVLQVAPFVDVGSTWNAGRESPERNSLASLGLGLIWQQSNRFTARLDYGIPLISVSSTERTWQENGLYFSVFYNPF
ncbi:ShlB/FhaC/HecB family hemolysin secretion/activation protein [Synechocystis sp. PCC 7509]|uniref:ShlB/FhaC/HecB family hemolysin secretion/activation protein n=1 Tax=Synechocystis sp. PCC 7509 TaxID=927677 RepID=UPI0002ACC35D|nr:ShlB/FhaC/HecB family hemolysin secretion/activation protein [Synechocystis sp. PCC 7509]